MDLRYLSARYENGKNFAAKHMDECHRYMEVEPTMAEAHSEILRFQSVSGDGGDAWLGVKNSRARRLRFTLMIIDVSSWPNRAPLAIINSVGCLQEPLRWIMQRTPQDRWPQQTATVQCCVSTRCRTLAWRRRAR